MDNFNLPPGMFGMFGATKPQPLGPTAEEIEAGLERVKFEKHVELKNHRVMIFDMHKPAELKEYEKIMKKLAVGVQTRTHHLWASQRALVPQHDGSQHWMYFMEWSEFELDKQAVAPGGD